MDVGTVDLASLERFQSELVQHDFEPVDNDRREWVGPIDDSFHGLTNATSMRLAFRDGWPFRPPKLFVEGMSSDHVNAHGEVCFWREGEGHPSEWISLADFRARIRQWCDHARDGFDLNDQMLDAHLYYENTSDKLAVFDASSIMGRVPADALMGHLHGVMYNDAFYLSRGERQSGAIRGRWYYRNQLAAVPMNLDGVRNALATGQARNLDRMLREIGRDEEPHVMLLLWSTPRGMNALALLLAKQGDNISSQALVAAQNDLTHLLLRAGPDASILGTKAITIFGAGAIGSHLALRLAESGIGKLTLIDGARLRPGNVARHASGRGSVGQTKVDAVAQCVSESAPWTTVVPVAQTIWTPERMVELTSGADLVIDATGVDNFTDAACALFEREAIPFLTFALFRGGAIGRIRRQAADRDIPILSRVDRPTIYPLIPPNTPAESEPLEAGCSAPINNAPPHAVAAIASAAVQCTIDWLTGRNLWPDEDIEIYSPLDVEPFNRLGRLQLQSHTSGSPNQS